MPVIPTTAYGTVEQVLMRARAYANDMEVVGGDVLTDTAPFTMQFVAGAYEHIQNYLAEHGVEVNAEEIWLLNVPANTSGDPESRVIIWDGGTEIITPSGQGESSYPTPLVPDDLIVPLELWERPNGQTNFAARMKRPNNGLRSCFNVGTFLGEWDWIGDSLRFRGATQAMDLRLKYEKQLPQLLEVTDQVPIRGVTEAAAWLTAFRFANGRAAAKADGFGQLGQVEIDLMVSRSVRERQRKKVRRRAYRGGHGRRGMYRGF